MGLGSYATLAYCINNVFFAPTFGRTLRVHLLHPSTNARSWYSATAFRVPWISISKDVKRDVIIYIYESCSGAVYFSFDLFQTRGRQGWLRAYNTCCLLTIPKSRVPTIHRAWLLQFHAVLLNPSVPSRHIFCVVREHQKKKLETNRKRTWNRVTRR